MEVGAMKPTNIFRKLSVPEYPLISIDGDGLMCINGPSIEAHEFCTIVPTEENAEVWLALEVEKP
jgi:hypothetical protein